MAALFRSEHAPWRTLLAAVCLVAGVATTFAGVLLCDAARGLFTADGFANRAALSLRDPRVASYVADRIADGVLRESPDLTSFRPLIRATAQSVVGSEAFGALARRAARRAHQAVFSERSRKVLLSVPDVGLLLGNALENASPELAKKIPLRASAMMGSLQTNHTAEIVVDIWRLGRRVTWFGVIGLIIGPLLLALALLAAVDRRRALFRIGIGLVIAAAVLILARPLGRMIVAHVPHDPSLRDATAGLWDASTHAWRAWTLLLGGVGLVLAAAAHSLLEQVEVGELVGRLLSGLHDPPGGQAGRLVRAGIFLALGLFAVITPGDAVDVFTVLVGAAIAFEGLRELFAFLLRHLPEEAAPEPEAEPGPRRWPLRTALVGGLAALLALGIVFVGRRSTQPPIVVNDACNGAPELCDRRVDQVVFPAAHNAMSAADIATWMFPEHEKGVRTQLDDGIRALLLDAHYGRPVGDRVKTDIDAEFGSAEKYESAVGPEGMAAAMRIRDRLVGQEEGPRGVYCAHGFCELGATPLESFLRDVHGFLVQNPNEVLLLVIEDYVTPQDLAAAFDASGLIEFVYRGSVTPPWATLREMVTEGQRVVVLAESGRPGVPWIHPAFETIQETPYTFHAPAQFSCAPNRGGTSGSLFMINHWIETAPTPKPSNAAIVNAFDFLLARCWTCQRERGHLPNLVGVDFYRTGDLFRVCRTLNGLEGASAVATAR
jgi:hypothetical protein